MNAAEKCYIILCTFFAVLVVTGNLIYQKFVYLPLSFYTFELSVGAIFYPLTFLITNLITEFFGKQKAKFCVQLAILMSLSIALIITLMNSLEATNWSKIDDQTFNNVFGVYGISLAGSLLANYTAQLLDIRLYLWIRKITHHKFLWIRNLSTAVSLLIDTTIVIVFITIFSNSIPFEQMIPLIINSYTFKLFFSICTTPLFYFLVYVIKSIVK